MVVVASPQPNELEQKKKRQTLERAKASHLSKQLQMRLQYAKLKVEHGWQRQNLNEVENLYFHHSIRHGHGGAQRPHYAAAAVAYLGHPAPVLADVPDQPVGPGPSLLSVPCQSPSEQGPTPDSSLSSQSHPSPPIPAPVLAVLGSSITPSTNCSPSAFDFSDPNILARLAQLQAQVQIPSQQTQSQSQTLVRQPLTTIVPPPTSTSTSTSVPIPGPLPVPIPVPVPVSVPLPTPTSAPSPNTFSQPPNHPIAFPSYPPQPFITTPPLYSTPVTPLASGSSQPSVPPTSVPISTAQAPPIASTALTYDSFWSTHASSSGSTRALYRTHTGFTASATPTGNVAMLTPGGHAAIMTAEGVYVGGANSRSG